MTTETPRRTTDVTGLTPDGVRAVEAVVAALRGQPVTTYTPVAPNGPPPGETAEEWIARWDAYIESVRSRPRREGVVEIDDDRGSLYDRQDGTVCEPASELLPPPAETVEEWVAGWEAWCDSHPKRDGVDLDDSRESIYDRSTE